MTDCGYSKLCVLFQLRERQVESISPQATSAMSTSPGTVQQPSTSAATDVEHRCEANNNN